MNFTENTRYTQQQLNDGYYFWGGFCSQWHPSPFIVNDIQYNCAEQFMMAEKARMFGDTETLNNIMSTDDPRIQKQLGRSVKRFNAQEWQETAARVVCVGNLAKFVQNVDLGNKLIDMGDRIIVEASPHDTIWGIGIGPDDPRRFDQSQWRGQNLLGRCIMQIRPEVISIYKGLAE